jgi:hypothetical protein
MPSLSTSTQIYTPGNCTFSAPLLWSVNLFWNEPEPDDSWTEALIRDLRKDDIRLLRHHFSDKQTSHLTVSTKIGDAPSFIVQRVKGRLYYLVKQRKPKPFRGNFAIRSIGKSSLAETQQYVMNQLGHHKMADPDLQSSLEPFADSERECGSQPSRNFIARSILVQFAYGVRTSGTMEYFERFSVGAGSAKDYFNCKAEWIEISGCRYPDRSRSFIGGLSLCPISTRHCDRISKCVGK